MKQLQKQQASMQVKEIIEKSIIQLAEKIIEALHLRQITQKNCIVHKKESKQLIQIKIQEPQKASKQSAQQINTNDQTKMRKYNNYSLDFKKKLVQNIRSQQKQTGISLTRIVSFKANVLGIHPKNIQRWYKEGNNLKERVGGRKPLFPEMEQKLIQFIEENPHAKRRQILNQARNIMQSLGYTVQKGYRFNFSKGWYQRFLSRKKNKIRDKKNENIETIKQPISESKRFNPSKIKVEQFQFDQQHETPSFKVHQLFNQKIDEDIPQQKPQSIRTFIIKKDDDQSKQNNTK